METASFYKDMQYLDNKPALQVIMNTPYVKEVRITFKKRQEMSSHKAPSPIVVQVLEGSIDFGVADNGRHTLSKGDMITLDANIVHDLVAQEDSIVRLSIHKSDR